MRVESAREQLFAIAADNEAKAADKGTPCQADRGYENDHRYEIAFSTIGAITATRPSPLPRAFYE